MVWEISKCQKCLKEFPENELEESHDIPKYMFDNPKDADKFGRHRLCHQCHNLYEKDVLQKATMNLIKSSDDQIKERCRFSAKIVKEYFFKDVTNEVK